MDLGDKVNSVADWVTTAPAVSAVIGSPLFTALLMTAIVAVIFMGIMDVKNIAKKKMFKLVVYTFLAILGMLFVHYFVVYNNCMSFADHTRGATLVSGINQVPIADRVAVAPRDGARPAVPPVQQPPGAYQQPAAAGPQYPAAYGMPIM